MFIHDGGLRKLFFAGAAIFVVMGFALILIRALATGSLVMIGGWMLAVSLIVLVVLAYAFATRSTEKSKRKRDMDMYSMIDRMVDDLDEDELTYLQNRLDNRRDVKNDDLAQSIESLLDQRSQDRKL